MNDRAERASLNSGAGIRLAVLNVLPMGFPWCLGSFQTTRKCRLIGRYVDLVSAAFDDLTEFATHDDRKPLLRK